MKVEKEKCQRGIDGDNGKCDNKAKELHRCPYDEEITGNEELCNCCDDCARECAWEI